MIEFGEQDSPVADEVMDVLKHYPDIDYRQLNKELVFSIRGLEIYPNRGKIYRGRKKINLTVKQYDLFCLPMLNFITCRQILIYKCRKERIKYVLENNSHINFDGVLFGLHRQDAFEEAGHTD